MDGFVIIDKELGLTSQQVVAKLKRGLRCKAGHCGTLDPAASGVLPVCLGRATRLAEYVLGQHKTYTAQICLGRETDSYDMDGTILSEQAAFHIRREEVEALLPRFQGPIMQIPPLVSALKKDGEALYKKARRGEAVQLEPRPVEIFSLRLLSFSGGQAHPTFSLEVVCGQGVYIRSLAHDVGQLLGCGACLIGLTRTRVGSFSLDKSFRADQVLDMAARGDTSFLIPPERAVPHLPSLACREEDLLRLSHGNDVALPAGDYPTQPSLRVLDPIGRLIGVGHVEERGAAPRLVMDKVLTDPLPAAVSRVPALAVAAIGNFDGLHLGHRALLEQVARMKKEAGGLSGLITFEPHPQTIITGKKPDLLISHRLKGYLARTSYGVDTIVTLDFTRQLMELSPEEFVRKIILDRLRVSRVVVGYNFTFGQGGRGTAETLAQICASHQVGATIVPEVDSPWGTISSTRIRQALRENDLAAVNAMLGYWLPLEGEVIHGNHIGRTLGFPTANILPAPDQALPQRGVYAGRVEYAGRVWPAVINFGIKPTIGGETQPLMEAHLLDEDVHLYGETIRVFLGAFIRPERRFSGLEELTTQITADCRTARDFLAQQGKNKHLPNPVQ